MKPISIQRHHERTMFMTLVKQNLQFSSCENFYNSGGGGRKQVLRLWQCTNMQKIMVYDLVRKRTRWPTDDNFNLRGAKYKQQCYSRAQKKHRYFKGFIIFSYQLSTNYNHTVSSNNKGHRHSMKPGCKNDTINNNHTKPAFVSGKSLEYFQFEFSWYCAHAFTRDAIARTPEE